MNEDNSERALLKFQVGQAQGFIGAARSVRDLWTGSYLLSWLTFKAMGPVIDQWKVDSILSPGLEGNPFLDAEGTATNEEKTIPCLPNQFIAIGPREGADRLAEACVQAFRDEWKRISDAVRSELNSELESSLEELPSEPWDHRWDNQVCDLFDVKAVVIPDKSPDDTTGSVLFDPARKPNPWADKMNILGGLLAARRSVRHVPNYRVGGDVPQKCSLMGSFEQMGPANLAESRQFWDAFAEVDVKGERVRGGEKLCAISLIKRFAWPAYFSRPEQLNVRVNDLSFYDSATVAARLWLPSDSTDGFDWRSERRWSGQWLHWPRRDPTDEPKFEHCPVGLWDAIQKWKRFAGPPPTYFAILIMDGDNLSHYLRDAENADASRKLSLTLTRFALGVREVIEHQFHGKVVYAGGDDLLVLIPTSEALACASELRRKYQQSWKENFDRDMKPPTTSAGIAVVHYKEDLRYALERARGAEKIAKDTKKDALGLTICRRSGEHTSVLLGWPDAERLTPVIREFAGRNGISDRWAYHLRAELPTLVGLPWETFRSELERLLGRIDGVTPQRGDTFRSDILSLFGAYQSEMRSRGQEDARISHDFVTLCQSASFLARGRDA